MGTGVVHDTHGLGSVSSCFWLLGWCVEPLYQFITQGKALIAGQAVEQGHEPLDEIHRGLDDRQFAAAGG